MGLTISGETQRLAMTPSELIRDSESEIRKMLPFRNMWLSDVNLLNKYKNFATMMLGIAICSLNLISHKFNELRLT